MASVDYEMEGSRSSFILDSAEPKQSVDVLVPEDVAWADSCLVNDSEISYSTWDSLKDALLEALQPDSHDFSAAGSDGFHGGMDVEIIPFSEEAQTSPTFGMTNDDGEDDASVSEEFETSDDYIILQKMLQSRTKLGYPFLPNYSEDQEEIKNAGSEFDLGSPVSTNAESIEDIFRVWDLNIPAEEDELVKQLDKALSESSLKPPPTMSDGSARLKDLKEDPSLDDLIAGIVDLSLNQNVG